MTSSSDEGEITEGTSKATSTRAAAEGSAVDRQNRRPSDDYDNESRYSSSSRRSRSPRGYKRSRDDGRNYDGRSRYDEQRRDHYNRPRVSYEDLDKPSSRGSYDDRYRDRYSDKRPRNRTRSPRRDKGRLDRFVRGSDDRRDGRDGPRDRDSASSRTPGSMAILDLRCLSQPVQRNLRSTMTTSLQSRSMRRLKLNAAVRGAPSSWPGQHPRRRCYVTP